MFSNKTMGYASFVMSHQLIPTTVIVPVIEFIKVLERVFCLANLKKLMFSTCFYLPMRNYHPVNVVAGINLR